MDDLTPKARSNKTPGLVLAFVAIAIVAGYLGYWIGTKYSKPAASPNVDLTAQLPTTKLANDSIITSQEAIAVGKIVKDDAGSITMQGKDGKISGFKLATKYTIYPLAASGSAAPKTSQNIQDLKLNQNYLVHLILQGTTYVATTIQGLPDNIK